MQTIIARIIHNKIWLWGGLLLPALVQRAQSLFARKGRRNHHFESIEDPHWGPEKEPAACCSSSPEKRDNAQIATSFFGGSERYNCVQAILRTYQKRFAIRDEEIAAAGKKGYGRVPGGLCGALYAGRLLLDDEQKSQQLTRDFESRAGSTRCKRILQLKYLSCKECVALTAQLLDSFFP